MFTTIMNRRYCSNTLAQAVPAATTTPAREHSGNKVWTVRAGSTGTGEALFQVYAPDMDEARDSASREIPNATFTVHAGQPIMPLKNNPFASADDFEWGALDGPDVRVDTVNGLIDAIFVDSDAGMVLVMPLESGVLTEFPAEALHPRCECGNPFSLCHPEA